MITKFFLMLKNFPHWLKQAKNSHPFLYAEFIGFNFVLVLILVNFLYFRDDYFYFLTLFMFPAFCLTYQAITNFSFPQRYIDLSRNEKTLQSGPMMLIFLLIAIHIPIIIYGKNVFGSEAYDEYFVYMIALFLILFFNFISKFINGKFRPIFLVLLYCISITLAIITYILAVTI